MLTGHRCVPILLASGFALAANSPPLFPLPSWLQVPYLPPNLGTVGGAIGFGSVWILLEPVAGTVLALIYLGIMALMNYFVQHDQVSTNWTAGTVHIACWLVQFVSHAFFEGRSPALLDNIFQAVVLAPLFVWLEVLFQFGYRPELHKRVDEAAAKEIARFRAANAEQTKKGQ
jgi:2-hydroxy fatty acid dioxygenase